MSTIECGVFDGINRAAGVVATLSACGFSSEDLSLVVQENEHTSITISTAANAASFLSSQASLLNPNLRYSLLMADSITVGGIGPVLATRPFAMVLAGTRRISGAANLMDALTGLHISDGNASTYAEAVRRGGSLLLINVPAHMFDRVQDILLLHHVVDLSQRVRRWRQQGWEHFDPHGLPCTHEELNRERFQQANENRRRCSYHPYEQDFRSHYYLMRAPGDEPYEYYAPAYRYGYRLVWERDYRGKDWSTVEPRARCQWERQEGQCWEAVADAVYYGFIKGRDHNQAWGDAIVQGASPNSPLEFEVADKQTGLRATG